MRIYYLTLLYLSFRIKYLHASELRSSGNENQERYFISQEKDASPNNEQKQQQIISIPCRETGLISAFYGLENDIGRNQFDGIPVIFSHEISRLTFSPRSFLITSASGITSQPQRVSLLPAIGNCELRTVLLLGDFGSYDDPPVKLEIVTNVLSRDFAVSFLGKEIEVVPYEDGPSLVLAEIVPREQWQLGKTGINIFIFSRGTNCPDSEETKQIVRVTWDGGVRKSGTGDEIDDLERLLYNITLLSSESESYGDIIHVNPFAIADLNDGDNNHELCLNVSGTPISVSFPAGFLEDPAGHVNNDTSVNITTVTDCT